MGPIRQELLTGIRTLDQFNRVSGALRLLEDVAVGVSTYELAAFLANRCSAAGIAAGHVDMLICAAAMQSRLQIWTLDADFARYAAVVPEVVLYQSSLLPASQP